MRIAIGTDHGGVELKTALIDHSREKGHAVIDCGTDGSSSVDYPDYAEKVCSKILGNEADRGILICKSGIGMTIAANKYRGIRAALVFNPAVAASSRSHNNTNVICLAASYVDVRLATRMLDIWLSTEFEGGRHQRRLDKLKSVRR